MKMSKKELDYLLIPNSGGELGKERKERAFREMGNRKIGEVLILNGKDSEEDILYLGKILKKGDRIGFDTFPILCRSLFYPILNSMLIICNFCYIVIY